MVPRPVRLMFYVSPLLILAVGALATLLSPSCQDFLDGPCKTNVLSDLAGLLLWLALPLSVLAAAGIAISELFVRRRMARERPRGTHDRA